MIKEKGKKIVLLGPPGSGKGSISQLLVKEHHFYHLSTGDLFRQNMNQNNCLGKKIKKIINSGKLIKNKWTNKMVKNQILSWKNTNNNIIFDGYPRNIKQWKFLSHLTKIDYIFDLQIDQEELLKRITGRRICPKCKKIYNIYYNKPKIKNICDNDQAALWQREDDKKEIVLKRYEQYLSNNKKLIMFCQKLPNYYQIKNINLSDTYKQICQICHLN